jgi:hypothetical protein
MFKIIPIDVFSTDVVISIGQSDDKLYAYLIQFLVRKILTFKSE